jgi:hypothetical protein
MSFIHEEQAVAHHVRKFIHAVMGNSIESFMSSDEEAIYAGEDWMGRIFEELKTAKVLISMLSKKSVRRPWINFEAGAASMGNTKVIPVCFGGLTIGKLPKPYSSFQGIALGTDEAHYYLVSSIAHHLKIDAPKRPLLLEEIGWSGYPENDDQEENGEDVTAIAEKELFPYKHLQMWLKAYEAIPDSEDLGS